jgi:hypothetical protein
LFPSSRKYDPGCSFRISKPDLEFFNPFQIPVAVVNKAPDPGSGSATLRIWIFMDLALIYPGSGSSCNEIDQHFIPTAFNFSTLDALKFVTIPNGLLLSFVDKNCTGYTLNNSNFV